MENERASHAKTQGTGTSTYDMYFLHDIVEKMRLLSPLEPHSHPFSYHIQESRYTAAKATSLVASSPSGDQIKRRSLVGHRSLLMQTRAGWNVS
jgi:hypothetical protein